MPRFKNSPQNLTWYCVYRAPPGLQHVDTNNKGILPVSDDSELWLIRVPADVIMNSFTCSHVLIANVQFAVDAFEGRSMTLPSKGSLSKDGSMTTTIEVRASLFASLLCEHVLHRLRACHMESSQVEIQMRVSRPARSLGMLHQLG